MSSDEQHKPLVNRVVSDKLVIAEHIESLNIVSPISIPVEPTKIYQNLPQPDYVNFIGRDKEFSYIKELLSIHNRAWAVLVWGIGGVGKSSLALEIGHYFLREYAELPAEEQFQAIIWLSAKANLLTPDGIFRRVKIARSLDEILTSIALTLEQDNILKASDERKRNVSMI